MSFRIDDTVKCLFLFFPGNTKERGEKKEPF